MVAAVVEPIRRAVAEFIGAFTLVFVGAGSILAAAAVHDPTLIGVAVAHGLAIAVMVSAVGHISGGHFNPAVTLGFLVTRRMAPLLALVYWVTQLVAATAADARGTFKSIAGLAIGLTITMDILAGGPLTGAAMNPARAFGPELVQNVWSDAWVWYVGPLVGGALAALAYDWLYLRPLAPEPVGPPETGVIEPRPG